MLGGVLSGGRYLWRPWGLLESQSKGKCPPDLPMRSPDCSYKDWDAQMSPGRGLLPPFTISWFLWLVSANDLLMVLHARCY